MKDHLKSVKLVHAHLDVNTTSSLSECLSSGFSGLKEWKADVRFPDSGGAVSLVHLDE